MQDVLFFGFFFFLSNSKGPLVALATDVSNLITSLPSYLFTHQLTFLSDPTNSFVCTNVAIALRTHKPLPLMCQS